jgi:hypothetical protein
MEPKTKSLADLMDTVCNVGDVPILMEISREVSEGAPCTEPTTTPELPAAIVAEPEK